MSLSKVRGVVVCAAVSALFLACGGGTETETDGGSQSTPNVDAGASTDASSSGDAASSSTPPARNASCTPLSQQTGTITNTKHGRLDGTLVYILPLDGSSSCNGDNSHVHLQIEVSGNIYDVAVDVGQSGDEVGMLQQTMTIPDGTWSEGWHGSDNLGYPSIGVKSTAMPLQAPTAIASAVEAALANTSKISIFCEGYSQGNGCHDVHYVNGSDYDGAIVIDPTSSSSPMLFFRFQSDSF